MPQKITLSSRQLLEEARRNIEEIAVADAIALVDDDSVILVDLRDPRELARDGTVPGAFHCPRGMLEFWIDPESPYFKPRFNEDKKYVFFCGGGLRSILAAEVAQRMGLKPVAHIIGGFADWRKAGGPIDAYEPKQH